MILAAGAVTYLFRTEILSAFRPVLFEPDFPLGTYMTFVLVGGTLFIAAYAVSGLYTMGTRTTVAEELSRVLVGSSAGILTAIIVIFLRQELFNSRFLVIGAWFFVIAFVSFGRLAIRGLQRWLAVHRDFGVKRVMVIGNDDVTKKISKELQRNPAHGYRLVRHLLDPEIGEVEREIRREMVEEVLLANPNYPAEKIVRLVDFCHENHITFKFVPNIYETLTKNYGVENIGNIPVLELKRTPLEGWGKVFKRMFDILFSAFSLLVLSPIIAIVALAIKWETAGPVFVRLKRVSRNRTFYLLKFRSMIENAEDLKPYLKQQNERKDGPLFKIRHDPRITKIGKFLRKYRIDELPQFWNIFRGDMTLVGPRPHQPDEIANYEKHHKKVLAIPAGATGLAQISGSSDLSFEEEVVLDTFYIENWSWWLDMKVVVKTCMKIFLDRSAV